MQHIFSGIARKSTKKQSALLRVKLYSELLLVCYHSKYINQYTQIGAVIPSASKVQVFDTALLLHIGE